MLTVVFVAVVTNIFKNKKADARLRLDYNK